MATYTYDPSLSATKDLVRFLIGDAGVPATEGGDLGASGSATAGGLPPALISDEEITAILETASSTYMACALCCEAIHGHLAKTGHGVRGENYTHDNALDEWRRKILRFNELADSDVVVVSDISEVKWLGARDDLEEQGDAVL